MSVRRSLAWSYGAQGVIFIQTFAVSVVVARLLGPYEMGIFALGLSAAGVLSIVSAFGVAPYLVRHEDPDSVKATVFTVNAILNVTLAALIASIALLGQAFGINTGVRHVLWLLSLTPLIGIFDFIPATFLQREMNFRVLSLIALGRALTNSAVLLVLALIGFGYLSPAAAMVASALFGAIASNAVARRHVTLRMALTGWRELTTFGAQMMSIGGVSSLVQRLSELILAHLQGIAALGIYSRASGLSSQIWDNVYGLGTRVIFSQMAKEMRETGTVRRTFIVGLAMITGLLWPMFSAIAVLSLPMIQTLYGHAWIDAALPLSLLMIYYLVGLGFGMNWELCVLRKRTGWQARNEAIRAAVGLAAFAVGASLSLIGAAASRLVEVLCGLAMFGPHMREMAGTEPGEIARVYRQSALLTCAAVSPAFIVMVTNDWSPVTSWWSITPAIVAGILLWVVALKALGHPLLAELVNVRRKLTQAFA